MRGFLGIQAALGFYETATVRGGFVYGQLGGRQRRLCRVRDAIKASDWGASTSLSSCTPERSDPLTGDATLQAVFNKIS